MTARRNIQVDFIFTSLHKTQLQMDFSIKPATLNLREEKMGNSLEIIGTEDNFLNTTSIVQATINKWDLKKLKSFGTANNTVIWNSQGHCHLDKAPA